VAHGSQQDEPGLFVCVAMTLGARLEATRGGVSGDLALNEKDRPLGAALWDEP
jgi:hypothetical protein